MEEYKITAEFDGKMIGEFETEEEAWKKLDKMIKKSEDKDIEDKVFVWLTKE